MSDKLQEFVETLGKSQLLRGSRLSIDDFSQLLVENGIITRWQCDKLLDKRFKGFYLDDYLILHQHRTDDERAYYVARNVETDEHVILGIQPISKNAPGDKQTHYQVLPYDSMKSVEETAFD